LGWRSERSKRCGYYFGLTFSPAPVTYSKDLGTKGVCGLHLYTDGMALSHPVGNN